MDSWELLSRIAVLLTLTGVLISIVVGLIKIVQFFTRLESKVDKMIEAHIEFTKTIGRLLERELR